MDTFMLRVYRSQKVHWTFGWPEPSLFLKVMFLLCHLRLISIAGLGFRFKFRYGFLHYAGFSMGSDSDSDPLIEMYVIGTEICPWDRDTSLKWVRYPFGKGIRMWVPDHGLCHCWTWIWIRTRTQIPVVCRYYGKGIWIWVSGNIFCVILCSCRDWNPSPNLSPNPSSMKISH